MSYDEALRRIEEATRTGATNLNLNGLDLTQVPPEIANLTNLRSLSLAVNGLTQLPREVATLASLLSLDIRNNQITQLPAEIAKLTNLRSLNLANNGLTLLPREIAKLTSLLSLDIRNNQITQLPAEIAKLTNLRSLNLASNGLTQLPREVAKLTSLLSLDIRGNQLTQLPPEIAMLTNLQSLNLAGNGLPQWPPGIATLTDLQSLDLRGNQLTQLPPEIAMLTNLQSLNLASNGLPRLPPEIATLTELQSLDLRGNQLTQLPPEIAKLINLQELRLDTNELTQLPPQISMLTNLKLLDLRRNWLSIPPEILQNYDDPSHIISFYTDLLAAEETRPLNEAKMILVGQGGVGKTSIVKRLIHDDFDPEEDKTPGIAIERWNVVAGGEDIRLNVWDFGGQEIMHATHQFFLTERSIYLLIINSREGDQERRIEYWLKIIKSFGGTSPVIVVLNKSDQHELDLDWTGLQKKYPNITDFASRVSCQSGEGISELREMVGYQIAKLEHIHDPLPSSWFGVKDELEAMAGADNVISYERYLGMCGTAIERDSSRENLIRLLHDLGTVLHFDDPILGESNVLNPEWVTNGVYQIINNNQLFKQGGVLNLSDLAEILTPASDYPTQRHPFITGMMQKFELCFGFPDQPNQRFLVPDLLPREQPYTGKWKDCLQFQYDYDVLPGSVISRLIVRMHAYIESTTYWRTGVVLKSEDGHNRALVRADLEDRRLFIHVNGNVHARRSFLGNIRGHLGAIHSSVKAIDAEGRVPISGSEVSVGYEHLLTLEEKGITNFIPEGLDEPVDVSLLLNSIDSAEEREKARRNSEDDLAHSGHSRSQRRTTSYSEPDPTARPATSPWTSGLFYLVVFLAIFGSSASVGALVSWIALPVLLIAGFIGVSLIALFQLRNDGKVDDNAFLKVFEVIFKRLHMLKP